MTGIRIERASTNDLDALAPLFAAYRAFYGLSPDAESERRFLRERLERGDSAAFLAWDSDRPCGFVHLYPSFSSLGMHAAWILNDLFVTPQARGKGVARLLTSHAGQFARESGAGSIWLQTGTGNFAAQHLYESLGYERDVMFYRYDLPLVTSQESS